MEGIEQCIEQIKLSIADILIIFKDKILKNFENVDEEGIETILQNTLQNVSIEVKYLDQTKKKLLTKKPSEINKSTTEESVSERSYSSKDPERSYDGSCQYVKVRGPTKGELCGKKAKSGSEFCSAHHDKGQPVVKDKVKPIVESKLSAPIKRTPVNVVKKEVHRNTFAKHPVLTDEEGNSLRWNEETGLFLKSRNEQFIVGKIIENEIYPLDDEDIKLCKLRSLNYQLPEVYEEEPIEEEPIEEEQVESLKKKKVKKVKEEENEEEQVKPRKKKIEKPDIVKVLKTVIKEPEDSDVEEE
jgi:hypothetical protein